MFADVNRSIILNLNSTKKMNGITKAGLTVPFLLGFVYIATYIFPNFLPSLRELDYPIRDYLQILLGLSMVLLLIRLRRFKNLGNGEKNKWTWLILIYGMISAPIYIWSVDDQLVEKNRALESESISQNTIN